MVLLVGGGREQAGTWQHVQDLEDRRGHLGGTCPGLGPGGGGEGRLVAVEGQGGKLGLAPLEREEQTFRVEVVFRGDQPANIV